MKKEKILLASIYFLIVGVFVLQISFLSANIKRGDNNQSVFKESYALPLEEVSVSKPIAGDDYYILNKDDDKIVYESETEFPIVATMNGHIKEIKEDKLILEGQDNIICTYSSLTNILVQENDEVKKDTILASSKKNDNNKYQMNFEVKQNNTIVNPSTFFKLKLKATD